MVDAAAGAGSANPDVLPPEHAGRYRHIVGALLYVATTTRPDIAFAVGMLTRTFACPTEGLLHEAERVLVYLYHTRTIAITYRADTVLQRLCADWAPVRGPVTDGHSDASFELGRSTSGYDFMLAGAAVAWGVKKQQSVALSTCEAEIMAGSLAACEAVFLRGLLTELGHAPPGPTVLRMDNSGAIDLAHDPVTHAKSKHIARRELKIRELVAEQVLAPVMVSSEKNVADIFTKPLPRITFQRHRAALLGLAQ